MTIQSFQYDLNVLRENIILLLREHGSQIESGDTVSTPIPLTVSLSGLMAQFDLLLKQNSPKVATATGNISAVINEITLMQRIEKLLNDGTPDMSSTGGQTSYIKNIGEIALIQRIEKLLNDGSPDISESSVNTSISLSELTIIPKVEKLIKDNTPNIATAIATSIAPFEINNSFIMKAAERAILDKTPRVQTSDSSTDTIQINNTNTIAAVDLMIQDAMPKLQSSATAGIITVSVPTIKTEILKLSAYKGSRLYGDKGELFDAITITSDEDDFVSSALSEAFNLIKNKLDNIITSTTENTTVYNFALASNSNIGSEYLGTLGKLLQEYFVNYVLYKWLFNAGHQKEGESNKAVCDEIFLSLNTILYEKTETLSNSIILACKDMEAALSFINASVYSYSSPNHIFTIQAGYDLSAVATKEIENIINKYIVNKTASDWLRKIGSDSFSIYEKEAVSMLSQLENFKAQKYETMLDAMINAGNVVQSVMVNITDAGYTSSSTVQTFSIGDGFNFTNVALGSLRGLITNYLIHSTARDWALKLGNNGADYFAKQAAGDLAEISNYTNLKYETFKEVMNIGVDELQAIFQKLCTYTYTSNTYNLTLTSTYNFSDNAKIALGNVMEQYLINLLAENWCIKMGIDSNKYKSEVDRVRFEILKYSHNKYNTLNAAFINASDELHNILKPLNFTYTYSALSYLYQCNPSLNLSDTALTSLGKLIEDYMLYRGMEEWAYKLSLPTFSKYKEDALLVLKQIQPYVLLKYNTFKEVFKIGVTELADALSMFGTYSTGTNTYTFTLATGFNLSTDARSALSGLIEQYLLYVGAKEWSLKVGNDVYKKYEVDAVKTMADIRYYTGQKYDTVKNTYAKAMGDIQQILGFVTHTPAVLTGDNYTYTLLNNGNFNFNTQATIKELIGQYMLNLGAFEWGVKTGLKEALIYKKQADEILTRLMPLVERKRDFIEKELKNAAYKVYSRFSFIGKGLVKPVLFNESYNYPEEELNDEVDSFTTVAATVDATGVIHYRMLMHGNYNDSGIDILDVYIEEALTNYVAMETFKYKNNQQGFAVCSQKYDANITDIRMNLMSRKKNKATRRGASWL